MSESPVRILVLDDEPFMNKLHTHMLAELGYHSVRACDNGPAALLLVEAPFPPNLILLDLNMPGMDGIEFVRELVERDYEGSLLLISCEDESVLHMAAALVNAHGITVLGQISKPVSGAVLGMMVKSWTPHATPRESKLYGPDELRSALANGELENHYQPQVDVVTGDLVGVETLVRWRHPTDGLVFPDRFIGVAEQHGLIDELTRVVLAGALAQAAAWRQLGMGLRVAVNISMDNLRSVDFVQWVLDAAAATDVAPQDLILEVTESRLMLDQRAPLEILTRLRLKRFRLAIDDFGTGHSSLAQMRDIRFDELKIDRSFVHRASHDKTARAMYSASLGLGQQLGMTVVAEGVEDRVDWDLVRRTKCDLAQGYFIARPMLAADVEGWSESWAARWPELDR